MTTKENLAVSESVKKEILTDYQIVCESREASLLGRKEVFMGKAKFGIFGDGKEVAQVAKARFFRKGDFRSGYYRDQTFMMAIGELTLQQYFAQLYAHTEVEAEPHSAGRSMNGHYATRMVDDNGVLKDLVNLKNSASDISPTAAQMPRLLGFAYASKLFRENKELHRFTHLSNYGNEIAFGMIGEASTSEGLFFEIMNAAGVIQVPILISVWDDGYGISVPVEAQTVKGSISKALSGFQRTENENGLEIFKVPGWDYEALCSTYSMAEKICRQEHVPVLVHVEELTQPQGHSTSGSHERYKSKERLEWESEYDCNLKMREWMLETGVATESELEAIEAHAKKAAKAGKDAAWKACTTEIESEQNELLSLLEDAAAEVEAVGPIIDQLATTNNPMRMDAQKAARAAARLMAHNQSPARQQLLDWIAGMEVLNRRRFNSHLYNETKFSSLHVQATEAVYSEHSPLLDGREVLRECFREALKRDPRIFAIGEDVGKIGDVNQGFSGLQKEFGEWRVSDSGIREGAIVGKGIGCAIRGLRPIVEIQYLDYIYYALMTLTDDLACLHYRTKGGQKAPVIIRTRGHRLEGIFHAGSPLGTILNALRGIWVLVPRNMTQAAGFYNTLLQSDDPALMIECLNAYRLKERLPDNVGEFTLPLGVPETLRVGEDVTLVTYGAMCRIVMEAAAELEKFGISAEVIDVQTLLPFDVHHHILKSIQKTGRAVFADEDMPGGASAYMMQQVLEEQDAWHALDSKPITISAKPHRTAYGSDGDYFSKPNVEEVFDKVYALMSEAQPGRFPPIYKF